MRILEIISNRELYYRLDILSSRYLKYFSHIRDTIEKMNEYKKLCLQNQMYGQWVDILNDLDEEIRDFIKMANSIVELINYFSIYSNNYVSRQHIIKLCEVIISLRKSLG